MPTTPPLDPAFIARLEASLRRGQAEAVHVLGEVTADANRRLLDELRERYNGYLDYAQRRRHEELRALFEEVKRRGADLNEPIPDAIADAMDAELRAAIERALDARRRLWAMHGRLVDHPASSPVDARAARDAQREIVDSLGLLLVDLLTSVHGHEADEDENV